MSSANDKPGHRRKDSVSSQVRKALSSANVFWPGRLDAVQREQLCSLIEQHAFCVAAGDLTLLDRKWYVTHSGLLRLARRNRCSGIQTEVLSQFSDCRLSRWFVKASVYKSHNSKGFAGYGDANPNNVSPLVRGAELRVAETRAVNRALRKAYGIGLCSVEELGTQPTRVDVEPRPAPVVNNDHGPARLRDRLLLLIRQHRLDAEQVKRYAIHFCGAKTLRETSREQIESLINHLTMLAAQGRDQLVAELNSVSTTGSGPVPAPNKIADGREESEEAA